MITLVAIKKDEIVYVGALGHRHSDVILSYPAKFTRDGIQGFVDEKGKFYTRREAARHAFDCGQLPNYKTCPDIILSEDLW